MKKKTGFTLAEILITLTVIGVVAALTIPTLLQKTNDVELKTALKKSYGDFQQAYIALAADNSGIEQVFSGDGSASADANAMNAFLTKFKYIKNCGSGMGCLYTTPLKCFDGSVCTANPDSGFNNNYGKAILNNGSLVIMNDFSETCLSDKGDGPLDSQVCGEFLIDVNGFKPPNARGKDYFSFWITKTGIYPKGSHNDGNPCGPGNDYLTSDGCAYKYLSE